MIYRITFGFDGAGVGWAETHAMLNGSNNPKDLFPTLADIATKRAQMLGREFRIKAIRVSRYATDAGVRAKGVQLLKGDWRNSVQTVSAGAEPASVALIATGYAEPSPFNPQFDANSNRTFLGAPLDVCVDDAGRVYEAKGGLGAAFASWRSAMLGTTIGWLANQTIAEIDLVGIAQNINGTVTYTVAAADTAALTVGQIYKARVRQVNNGQSPLNIEQKVKVKSATELVTRRVIGIPTAQANGVIRIYKQVQPFVDYGDLVLSAEVGKHKRGRPFGSSPGRRPRQILG